jgi:uncharacterized protein (TIGR02757 family)
MKTKLNRTAFEQIYESFNKRELVVNDPLKFLYKYENIRDREIVGLIASSLAYGRVAQIQKSVETILVKINSPHHFILETPMKQMTELFSGFKHRFTTDIELVIFLGNIRNVIKEFGSLEECFHSGYSKSEKNVYSALLNFSFHLLKLSPCRNSLMPDPSKKSAFKRLNLYLRWMVRRDNIDPGGWEGIETSKLIFPLDTHIQKLGKALGLTERNQNDYRTAVEITGAFKELCPIDPVKYDFPLTCLCMQSVSLDKLIIDYKMIS